MKQVVLWVSVTAIFLMPGFASAQESNMKTNADQPGLARPAEKATFGAGCFWGVEKVFGDIPGVLETRVGYTGGSLKNPTYEQVCDSNTGHAEAVEITYDPSGISYDSLLEIFWTHHDPTTPDRQGNDRGPQYRSVIFYHTREQKSAALESRDRLERSGVFGAPIVTQIEPVEIFYPAEEYHQKYLKKNPQGYCRIPAQSRRIIDILRSQNKQA